MSGVTVIVIENRDVERVYSLLAQNKIPHYEMESYFDIEGFTTLEEVEAWDKDK